MTHSRFVLALLLGITISFSSVADGGDAPYLLENSTTAGLPNGIAVGDVTQDSFVLWARSSQVGDLTFIVTAQQPGSSEGRVDTRIVSVDEPMRPAKIVVDAIDGLAVAPGMAIDYTVIDTAGEALSGSFTIPANDAGGSTGLRFGVTGDWRGELAPYPALANATQMPLDFFVMHGDTIYADVPSIDLPIRQARTLAEFRIKHNEVYGGRHGVNYFAALRANAPVLATIDDHEITDNFAGGAPPQSDPRFDSDLDYINQSDLYINGLQSFFEYNPLRDTIYTDTGDPRMDGRPQLYRYNTYGTDAAVYVLDSRSFRDAPLDVSENPLNPVAVAAFFRESWTPDRTFLGRTQVEDLKRDLLDAHQRGITWKFIMLPEPMQQMGVFGGTDRWESYAPERAEVMQFIEDNSIRNVVFVSADIHSTFINDITYQTEANGDLIQTHTWEITTGAVAYWPPTGVIAARLATPLAGAEVREQYVNADLPERDAILTDVFSEFVMELQDLDPLGIDESDLVQVELLEGSWAAGHTYGWTLFEIAPETQVLTVTTFGVPAYEESQMTDDPQTFAFLTPEVVNQLRATPQFD